MVKELTDAAIDAHLAQAGKSPSPLSLMHLYPIDGAVRRVGRSDTAWSTRDATWCMVIAGIDADPLGGGPEEAFKADKRVNLPPGRYLLWNMSTPSERTEIEVADGQTLEVKIERQ